MPTGYYNSNKLPPLVTPSKLRHRQKSKLGDLVLGMRECMLGVGQGGWIGHKTHDSPKGDLQKVQCEMLFFNHDSASFILSCNETVIGVTRPY